MDTRKYWKTNPTAREMRMEQVGEAHTRIELVGGPKDGKVYKEGEGLKVSHDPSELYVIEGQSYSPSKVENGVLKMKWLGTYNGG